MIAGASVAAILHPFGSDARRPHSSFGSYDAFLSHVRSQGRALGISSTVLDAALRLDRPNPRVLELDRNQPEFKLTWGEYRRRVLTEKRLQQARVSHQERNALLSGIGRRYAVDPAVVVGIWGLESDFGRRTGTFNVIDSLATLAFDGRRDAFFQAELIDALRILQQADVRLAGMSGSYAGAMGQPQFMPSSYLRYAIDYDGDGRRDIWASEPDVFASIANYLARNGWIAGAPWGQSIAMPPQFGSVPIGRQVRRRLGDWMRIGVRRSDGGKFKRDDVLGAVLMPDGPGGDAFMVYDNFEVIRRYNPSDFYGLAVGLLGGAAT